MRSNRTSQSSRLSRWRWLPALLVPVLVASACTASEGGSGGSDGSGPDTLRVVQAVPVNSFYQNVDFDRRVRRVTESVHEKLLDFQYQNETFEISPLLATEWEQVDPHRWRFTLRDGVEFSDGSSFDSEDVVTSFETLVGNESSVYLPFLGSYEVEAPDPTHVDVITPEANDAVLPMHMSMLQIVPAEYADEDGRVEEGGAPVGTGPYVVTDFKKGVELTLEANDGYWGDAPKIQEIQVRFAADPASRVSELQSGQADLIDAVPPLLEDRVSGIDGAEVRKSPTLVKLHLVFNSLKPPADDVALRKAINYAIDREQIVELFRGNAEILYGAFAPGEPGYSSDFQPFPYDPDKARQLIEEAGLEGTEITLGHSIGEIPEDKAIAENIQAQLAEVGIEAKLSGGPLSTTNKKFIEGQQPGAFLVQNGPVYPDPEFTFRAHMGLQSTYGKAYGSAKVDDLMAEVLTTADTAERVELYQQMEQVGIAEEAFWAPLVVLTDIWGVNKNLDWTPIPDQTYRFASMSFK